jgi:hypothetical protein
MTNDPIYSFIITAPHRQTGIPTQGTIQASGEDADQAEQKVIAHLDSLGLVGYTLEWDYDNQDPVHDTPLTQ